MVANDGEDLLSLPQINKVFYPYLSIMGKFRMNMKVNSHGFRIHIEWPPQLESKL